MTVGQGGRAAPSDKEPSRGLSTGEKVAIGAGAIAIIGCYEAGCFKRLKSGLETERERLHAKASSSKEPAVQPQVR